MKEKNHYVIIGSGIAGLSAAEAIRKKDALGEITIVGAEDYLPYYRVKLSHYISKTFTEQELLIHNAAWYEERRINVLLDKNVKKLEILSNTIKLDDGSSIAYDKLLLATGSHPFIPPIQGNNTDGVFALRTLKDLKHLQSFLKGCETITVIGGGLLGLEAAWAVKELGKTVNVIEFFPYLLPRQLDEQTAHVFTNELEKKGLNFYLGVGTQKILGEGKVNGVQLQDGSVVKTDAVLFSAGIRPNLDLVQDTTIDFDKGIRIDTSMKTNIENIYAAGDVTEFKSSVMGLWGVANDQGKIAGENMAGGNLTYEAIEPNTLLNIGGFSVFSIGNIKDFDNILETTDEEKKAHYKLYITQGQLTGAVVMGDMSKVVKVKKLVNSNKDLGQQIEQGLGAKEIIERV
ncbi:nitrite reductase (NADH) large subunit [Anaerovirgula multivorans]|uniref:Nitrite reductase (NADH) large subunit n=1 Tax=Anaerovirgula multivorans TaxID=312168 RepID=A0A239HX27_9FIRM|nr:FAD-dependent oxidoreductase [Anaerovirgula multivorans]SNS85865.1 nitrite reductase (NADH) large subunit [Anaerovirgula multivorans]